MEQLLRDCLVFTAHRNGQSSDKLLSPGTGGLNCRDCYCYLHGNFIYKHCTTSKTINPCSTQTRTVYTPKYLDFVKADNEDFVQEKGK